MKKTLLISILALIFSSCGSIKSTRNSSSATLDFNDNTDVEILLQNGQKIQGKMNFPENFRVKKIEISIAKKIEKIEVKSIDKLFYTSSSGHKIEYHNLKISDKKDKRYLMYLAIPIGKVKLYTYSYINTNFGSMYNTTSYFNSGAIAFYCKRDGEPHATGVAYNDGNGTNRNSYFKKRASEYFLDNKEIVRKIKNKEYRYTDIIQVVLDYNGQKVGLK